MASRILVDCGYPESANYESDFLQMAQLHDAEFFSSGQGFGSRDYGFIFENENKAIDFINSIIQHFPEAWTCDPFLMD